jgi:hypothetical protein
MSARTVFTSLATGTIVLATAGFSVAPAGHVVAGTRVGKAAGHVVAGTRVGKAAGHVVAGTRVGKAAGHVIAGTRVG